MSKEPNQTVSPTEVFIDGKSYTLKQIQRYIKFYNDHQIERGQKMCPLCGCYYDENELFVCDSCGTLLSTDELCYRHEHFSEKVCKECCASCSTEKAFGDALNQKIDSARGK